jgi:hypothetical protein
VPEVRKVDADGPRSVQQHGPEQALRREKAMTTIRMSCGVPSCYRSDGRRLMIVSQEDMELIRDALNAAEDNLPALTSADVIRLVQKARKRTDWYMSAIPDPMDESGNPQIMRGWLRERPEGKR